jgi:hypothetical protein
VFAEEALALVRAALGGGLQVLLFPIRSVGLVPCKALACLFMVYTYIKEEKLHHNNSVQGAQLLSAG